MTKFCGPMDEHGRSVNLSRKEREEITRRYIDRMREWEEKKKKEKILQEPKCEVENDDSRKED